MEVGLPYKDSALATFMASCTSSSKKISVVENGLPQKLPQTAYPSSQPMSQAGSISGDSESYDRGAEECKSFPEKNMGVSDQSETPIVSVKIGEGGIRTRGTSLNSYDGLANRYLQPLGHLSKSLFLKSLLLLRKSIHICKRH